MNKGLNIALTIISKILEVMHWIVAVVGLVLLGISFVDNSIFAEIAAEDGPELICYGFETSVLASTGEVNMYAVAIFWIGVFLNCGLMAMVFRNINIILRTIAGKYKNATSTSPFQKDVVRRVREIGIFTIAIPVVGFILSTAITGISLLNGISTEVNVAFDSAVIGLICLSLSQIFAYGAKLEEEVDGLL